MQFLGNCFMFSRVFNPPISRWTPFFLLFRALLKITHLSTNWSFYSQSSMYLEVGVLIKKQLDYRLLERELCKKKASLTHLQPMLHFYIPWKH